MELSFSIGATPTGQSQAHMLPPEQNSTLGASVMEQSLGQALKSNSEPTSGEGVVPTQVGVSTDPARSQSELL